MTTITTDEVLAAGLEDWRPLHGALHARYRTGDFVTGLRLVTAITDAAEEANHHPDVTLTYPLVDLRLVSHDVGALTQRDLDMARRITEIARGQGVAAEPVATSLATVALDTADAAAIAPFWSAALTGSPDNVVDDKVIDPTNRVPMLWFQPAEEHDTARMRFHLDVYVPPEEAAGRVAAIAAAGGAVVDRSHEPAWTVLADADDNKVCVCTDLDEADQGAEQPAEQA